MRRILAKFLIICVWVPVARAGILVLEAPPKPKVIPGGPPLVLENFEAKYEWTGGNEVKGKKDYSVVADGNNKVLAARYIAGTDGKMIYRRLLNWNTEQYPFLTWRWRVLAFPAGAKVLIDEKSDSPAQVYVAWRENGRIYGLKYFWTETDPVGTTFLKGKYNPIGVYLGIFVRMGGALNEWQSEKRNVREDYKLAFGKEAPAQVNGIGILSDGDQTKTLPAADYDDFIAIAN